MQPGPGSLVPNTAEMKPAVSMPWAIRPLNMVGLANSSSRWTGLVSPVMPANRTISASLTVLEKTAVMPSLISSRYLPRNSSIWPSKTADFPAIARHYIGRAPRSQGITLRREKTGFHVISMGSGIDRDLVPMAEDILDDESGREQIGLAAGLAHHLNADRAPVGRKAGRQRQRRAGRH